jgi:hypothetical protein
MNIGMIVGGSIAVVAILVWVVATATATMRPEERLVNIVLLSGTVGIVAVIAVLFGGVALAGYLYRIAKDMEPGIHYMGIAGVAIIMLTLFTVCVLCFRAMPREAFEDLSGDSALLTDIAAAEEAVCKLITRVDGFIQNDVGPAGVDDPSQVVAARAKARQGVAMVDCSGTQEDAAHRITQLEETLRSFTGPELQRTYDTAMKCEGFQSGSTAAGVPSLRDRLSAIQKTLQDQQTRLLAPIDQKTEDLKKGIASDCDKRRGTAHMTAKKAST